MKLVYIIYYKHKLILHAHRRRRHWSFVKTRKLNYSTTLYFNYLKYKIKNKHLRWK